MVFGSEKCVVKRVQDACMNYVTLDRFSAFGITLQYLTLILILSLTLMMSALIFFEFSFLHLPWKVEGGRRR